MKKCLIIYSSYHHGNTAKLANAMAEASGAEIRTVDRVQDADLDQYEIIGFGSGIAYGKHYDKLTKAMNQFRVQGKDVFVFSTSGTGNINYNAALIDLLKKSGASVIGSFACKGYDTFGPFKLIGGVSKGHPNSDDLAAAKKFIQRMTT